MIPPALDRNEIESQVKRQYLIRLDQKIPTLRRLYHQKRWMLLRNECEQLKKSSINHGLKRISELAARAEQQIPPKMNKATLPAVEDLVREVNSLVIRELPGSSNYYIL